MSYPLQEDIYLRGSSGHTERKYLTQARLFWEYSNWPATELNENHFHDYLIKHLLKIRFRYGIPFNIGILHSSLSGLQFDIEVIPGTAMGLALTTIMAQCVGANEYKQAKHYIKQMIKLAYICLIGFNLIMLVLLSPLLGVYSLSPETFELSFKIMLIHGIATMIIWPISFVLPNAFRAVSDVWFPILISILSMLVFRIGFSYLLVYSAGLGVLSVWFAMTIDWTFRSVCFAWRYLSGKWKRMKNSRESGLVLTTSEAISKVT